MISFMYSCWKYFQLYKKSSSFYLLTTTKEITETDIDQFTQEIIPIIKQCGCVCVKFCQWLIPILEIMYNKDNKQTGWLTRLEKFYENCNTHEINHTERVYQKEFNEQLSDTYEIIDIIGSGSIGQVYQIKHRESKEYFAMKVLHPNVSSQLYLFKWIIYILNSVSSIRKHLHTIIPVDLVEFIRLFEKQLDMHHEANNLSLMNYNNRKETNYIKIPYLIKSSSSILIMSYEPGTPFDNIDISEYEKRKLFILLYMYCRYNFEHKNFNHADLHKGNWKITDDKKIQLYDFGYCYTLNNMKVVNLLSKAILDTHNKSTDENIESMCDLSCELYNDYSMDLRNYVKEYFSKLDKTIISDPNVLLNVLCSVSLKINKLLDPYILQALITQIQNNKYLTKYNINNNLEKWDGNQVYYRREYITYYTICNTYGIFQELQDSFKKMFNESDAEVNDIFETIDNKNIFTDEIKSLLKFD